MKKLLLLFAVMLSAVGAWAQTFTLLKSTNVENPEHQYLMKNGDDVFMDSQTSYVSGEKVNGRFAFFAYGENDADVLIYSIDAKKWVSYEIAGSYDNQRDFAQLIEEQEDAKPWRFSLNENTGVPVYQFAPHNTTNVASKYMNWYEGTANNKVQNSVGLYSSAANSDAGSAWSLWPLTSQMCYLRDVKDNYLNISQLGQDAHEYENTLATITTVPTPLYVNVAIDGRWQIHTSVDGGNYLKQSSWIGWNSQVTEGSGDYYWTIEHVNADGVKYLVLKNTSGNQDGYLGNDNHTDGTPLYVNTKKDSQGVKLQILDAETEFAHITYSLNYKGENKGAEEYYSPIGKKFPKLLFAKDYIYPVMPSGNVGIEDDGRECKINLVDNLPFQVSDNYENARWYYMNIRTNKWVASSVAETPYPNNTNQNKGNEGQWAFVGDPFDGIKVLNRAAGTGKTLGVDANSNVIMLDSETSWIIQKGNGGFVLLQQQGTNKYVHDYEGTLKIWNDGGAKGDNGSAFTVKDVDAWGYPQTVTIGSKITDLSTIVDGQMVVFKNVNNNKYVTLSYDLETTISQNPTGLSVFKLHVKDAQEFKYTIESEREGYYFPDITIHGSQDVYMESSDSPNQYQILTTMTDGTTLSDGQFVIKSLGANEGYFDLNAGTDFCGWQGKGANSKYEIYPVTVNGEISQITRNAILTETNSGEIYQSNYLCFEGQEPVIAGIPVSNKQNVGSTFTADIAIPLPLSKEGGMTNATMISNFDEDKKWIAKLEDGIYNVKCFDITSIPTFEEFSAGSWAIYPNFDNGHFTFRIKNIAIGKYITLNSDVTAFDTKGTVTLTDNPTSLDMIMWHTDYPCFRKAGKTLYLTVNSPGDTGVYLSTYTGGNNNHEGNRHFFTTPSFQTSITSAKAATLYTPVAVTIPEGVTAKYVKAEGENMGSTGKLVYTKLNDVIPANSAVVLTGEPGNYTFTATTEAGEAVTDNVLFGYATETAATDNTGIYALANKTNGVAFYPFVGTTYKAGKAYLNISGLSASEVRFFNIFDEGEETAIEDIQGAEDAADAVVYDLAGRRVQKAQKGLYIVNGKKVIK